MRGRLLIAVLLVTATFAVYGQVRHHEFVNYDDRLYVAENPQLRAGPSLESLAHAFTEPYANNWVPLTWLSLQLDYALYGLEPAGYHLTNVALHALSSVLLFLALARATGATGRSAFVAAVFALHPLHVESVAWAAERKDSLSGLFWMLSLLAYVRYAERPGPARYAAVAAGVALALLAKPMAVTLPLVLLLLDYWPLGRLGTAERLLDRARTTRAVIEKLPLLALCAAVAAVTFSVQRAGGATGFGEMLPFMLRFMNAMDSYVVYLAQSLWPSGLAVYYPHPIGSTWAAPAGVSALFLLIATGVALRYAASSPYLVVGWLWYLGTLVPVIGIVQVGMQARADRYTYLPLVGLSIALAWSAVDGLGRGRAARRALAAAGVAVPLALGAAAWVQVGYWRDTATLFGRAVSVTEHNFVAHQYLAGALLERGELDEAAAHYAEAARLRPGWVEPRVGIAEVLTQRGELEQAFALYQRELARDPSNARAAGSYGLALLQAGRLAEAHPLLRQALEAHPRAGELHAGLAIASAGLGRPRDAIRHYRAALRLEPRSRVAANNLAWLLATTPDAALRDPHEAVRLAEAIAGAEASPEPDVLDTLAAAYAAAGRFDEAVRAATRAVGLAQADGGDALARQIRARLELYRRGQAYTERAG